MYAGNAAAGSLRCDGRLVSEGDFKQDVRAICGPPTFVDGYKEERTLQTFRRDRDLSGRRTEKTSGVRKHHEGDPLENLREGGDHIDRSQLVHEQSLITSFEEWTYNLGPHRFVRTLTFENERLVSIKDGTYGYDKAPGNLNAHKGDSKAVVWLKYGPANEVSQHITYDRRLSRREDGNYVYVETVLKPNIEDQWVYDFGSDKYRRKLIFWDGILRQIDVLKTKGR